MDTADMVTTRIRFSERKSRSVNILAATGFGTSTNCPVPKNRRKPGSSIRRNQTLWESGFLWPGIPARYQGVDGPTPYSVIYIYNVYKYIPHFYRTLVLRRLTPMAIKSATCSLGCLMRPMHPQFFSRPNGV